MLLLYILKIDFVLLNIKAYEVIDQSHCIACGSHEFEGPTRKFTKIKNPSDQSILQVPGTSVSWEYPNAADYYILKVATDSLMKQIVFQDDRCTRHAANGS